MKRTYLLWTAALLLAPQIVRAQDPRLLGVRITRDREVVLSNLGEEPIQFDQFFFNSLSGLLDTNGWRSVTQAAFEDPLLVESTLGFDALSFGIVEQTPSQLIEELPSGFAELAPGGEFSLGMPYAPSYMALMTLAHNGELTFGFRQPGGTVVAYSLTVWKPIAGDVNSDDSVDLVDFNTLKSNFGLVGAFYDEGDLDDSTLIDLVDFNILKEHFGDTLESVIAEALGDEAAVVPEPASVWLLAATAAAAFGLSIRRRKGSPS